MWRPKPSPPCWRRSAPDNRIVPLKTAIVLFNLGGPDHPRSVDAFRRNLFSDPAIIRAPWFIRFWLARLIAASSARQARRNYALMGGKSPLLDFTQVQAAALERALAHLGARCFIAMRYWHPFAWETVRAVREFAPERILLLPLYPQFSTTTTASSLRQWREQAARAGLVAEVTSLCCFYADAGYGDAIAALVEQSILEARAKLGDKFPLRILFSAHGLPEAIIAGGDPYQMQIEATAATVMARLAHYGAGHQVCYQSRATPQRWLTPSTLDAVAQAGADRVAVVVVPIAFVSDHVETLVELDIEVAEHARALGVPGYFRAAAPNDDARFIAALAGIAGRALARGPGLCSDSGGRRCGAAHAGCPVHAAHAGCPLPAVPGTVMVHPDAA